MEKHIYEWNISKHESGNMTPEVHHLQLLEMYLKEKNKRFHYTPITMTKIKNNNNTKGCQGCRTMDGDTYISLFFSIQTFKTFYLFF